MDKKLSSLILLTLMAPALYGAVPERLSIAKAEVHDLFRKRKPVFFINLELLYWTVTESAIDYAIEMKKPAWSDTVDTYAVGHYKNARFGFDPGFRFAFGYYNAPHYWDLYGQITYLSVHGKDQAKAPTQPGRFLNGTWIQPDFNTTATSTPLQSAKSDIGMHYTIPEALCSRRFNPNPHLRFMLFGGLTSAFIHQNWVVNYEDLDGFESTIRNKWNFAGMGVRLGSRLDWFMGWDIYISGIASTALLSGQYKNRSEQTTSFPVVGADNSVPFRDTHYNDLRITYNPQFQLGLSWQKSFKTVRTELFAGYEFNLWSNLQEIYRSSLAGATAGKDTYINSSNVSLQGLNVRWNIDF